MSKKSKLIRSVNVCFLACLMLSFVSLQAFCAGLPSDFVAYVNRVTVGVGSPAPSLSDDYLISISFSPLYDSWDEHYLAWDSAQDGFLNNFAFSGLRYEEKEPFLKERIVEMRTHRRQARTRKQARASVEGILPVQMTQAHHLVVSGRLKRINGAFEGVLEQQTQRIAGGFVDANASIRTEIVRGLLDGTVTLKALPDRRRIRTCHVNATNSKVVIIDESQIAIDDARVYLFERVRGQSSWTRKESRVLSGTRSFDRFWFPFDGLTEFGSFKIQGPLGTSKSSALFTGLDGTKESMKAVSVPRELSEQDQLLLQTMGYPISLL